jgi:predicted Co/Zn/Cd cation transporter (cation efflux family)
VLQIPHPDDEVAQRINEAMRKIAADDDIVDDSTHVAKSERIHCIEINIVVGSQFKTRSVPELDPVLDRIWRAVGQPPDKAWPGILFTADPRWR